MTADRDTATRTPHARDAERAENFPVAPWLLPRDVRDHLRAVYDVVRAIDDAGDDPTAGPDARRAHLDELAADLDRLYAPGTPRADVLRRLAPTVAARDLPREPFDRLVAAGRHDQDVADHATRAELLEYCALSAAPIGRLVLALAGVDAEPSLVAAADRVCAGLQLVEHWADLAEDRAGGRVYLPAEDRAAFGVDATDLDAASASPALRRLVRHETDWAASLLADGPGVVARLRGWPRIAVAGYVAGGRAAVDAVHRTGGDVLGSRARTRRRDVVRHLLSLLRPWGGPR